MIRVYKVRFQGTIIGILGFPSTLKGFEIYEAESASKAISACKAEFEKKAQESGLDTEEIEFRVLDVEAV